MKNINISTYGDNSPSFEELKKQVAETHGHIIISWSPKLQMQYPGLIYNAIELDESNLKRISKEFYMTHPIELVEKINQSNLYYVPEYAYDSNIVFLELYINIFAETDNKISDSFFYLHIDSLRAAVNRNPNLLRYLDKSIQEYLLPEIKKLLEISPNTFEYLSDELIFSHIDLAESALESKPEYFYILPYGITNRFESLFNYLTSDMIETIAINGIKIDDETTWYPKVTNKNVLTNLINKNSYAILFASDKILLKMKSKTLSKKLENNALRNFFVEKNPFIAMVKKIKP